METSEKATDTLTFPIKGFDFIKPEACATQAEEGYFNDSPFSKFRTGSV